MKTHSISETYVSDSPSKSFENRYMYMMYLKRLTFHVVGTGKQVHFGIMSLEHYIVTNNVCVSSTSMFMKAKLHFPHRLVVNITEHLLREFIIVGRYIHIHVLIYPWIPTEIIEILALMKAAVSLPSSEQG